MLGQFAKKNVKKMLQLAAQTCKKKMMFSLFYTELSVFLHVFLHLSASLSLSDRGPALKWICCG